MTYEYQCKNEKCKNKEIKTVSMSIKDYSEDKLPLCETCQEKTKRIYSSVGISTFGDGYKS
jgi:predicted nucleic acid-binding Zn ribbon protein